MEPEEHATYRLLVQVLNSHIRTHRLGIVQVHTTIVGLLGDLGLKLHAARIDVRTFGRDCATQVMQSLRARQDRPKAFPWFGDTEEDIF